MAGAATSKYFSGEQHINNECDMKCEEPKEKVSASKCEKRKSSLTLTDPIKWLKSCEEIEPLNHPDCNLTALEKQFRKLKEDNPDVVLFIETGYLFRLFCEDAQVAKKELNFRLSAGHNLPTTSFPLPNLAIHIRHLTFKGYKVGVVRKVESGLMKASGTAPNDICKREITALYTSSTLIGEDVNFSTCNSDEVDAKSFRDESGVYLMSLYELPVTTQKVRIGVVAVCLQSGDFVYEHFADDDSRYHTQNCFQSVNPVEIIIPKFAISDATYNFINARKQMNGRANNNLRIESMVDDNFGLQNIGQFLNDFFKQLDCHKYMEGVEDLVQYILLLPPPVICAVRALINYLKQFKLEYIFTLIKQMRLISSKLDSVRLDSNTIRSLELLRCNWTWTLEGSLYHLLDQTSTPFGSRLLKHWLCHPLKYVSQINERLDVVEFLVKSDSEFIYSLKKTLSKFPDLESGITLIYNKRSSPRLYWRIIQTFISIRHFIKSAEREIEMNITNEYLKQLLKGIVDLTEEIDDLLKNLCSEAACQNSKANLFKDCSQFPNLLVAAEEIENAKNQLDNCSSEIAKSVIGHELAYGSFYDKKYVIIMQTAWEHLIPNDWIIVARNSNKICCRTKETEILVRRLKLLEEHYKYQCNLAWMEYLNNFKPIYFKLRNVIVNLATVDCLLSLAVISKSSNYSKPTVVSRSNNEHMITIKDGFHPTISRTLDVFVKNDTNLSILDKSCMIISGANMSGKSAYIRQVAIVTLMAQIGCFVPAEYASLTPVDAIYVRSGVTDNIMQGRSAFFVEVEDIANVLNAATSNSLVLIDEFGRCTSDSDGSNLLFSIIKYIVTNLQCLTLVVNSQFLEVSRLQEIYPNKVSCYHMTIFGPSLDNDAAVEDHDIVYLYKLERGIADKSFAIYVAKMAGIDPAILNSSLKKSKELEEYRNNLRTSIRSFQNLIIDTNHEFK